MSEVLIIHQLLINLLEESSCRKASSRSKRGARGEWPGGLNVAKEKLGGLTRAFDVSREKFFFLKRGEEGDGRWERRVVSRNRAVKAADRRRRRGAPHLVCLHPAAVEGKGRRPVWASGALARSCSAVAQDLRHETRTFGGLRLWC